MEEITDENGTFKLNPIHLPNPVYDGLLHTGFYYRQRVNFYAEKPGKHKERERERNHLVYVNFTETALNENWLLTHFFSDVFEQMPDMCQNICLSYIKWWISSVMKFIFLKGSNLHIYKRWHYEFRGPTIWISLSSYITQQELVSQRVMKHDHFPSVLRLWELCYSLWVPECTENITNEQR